MIIHKAGYCQRCLVKKLLEIVYLINTGYCQQCLVNKLLEIVYQINTGGRPDCDVEEMSDNVHPAAGRENENVEDVDAGGQDAAAADTGASAGSQSFIFLHSKNISVVTQTTSEDVKEDGETKSEIRTVDSQPSFCMCGHCRELPTPDEKRCCGRKPAECTSIQNNLYDIITNVKKNPKCPQVKSKQEERFINDRKRKECYRKLVEKIYGKLGRRNRKPLPACCVWKIRDQFPDPFGKYQGFRKAK